MQRLNPSPRVPAVWLLLSLLGALQFAVALAVSSGWLVSQAALWAAALLPVALCVLVGWPLATWADRSTARAESQGGNFERTLARRNRRLLTLVQEAGHVGFFTYQFGSDELCWTPGLARLFGRPAKRVDSTLAEFTAQLEAPDHRRFQEALQTAIEEGQATLSQSVRIHWPNGESRNLSARLSLRYDEDGLPLEALGACVDTTDRLEVEAARQAVRDSERALQAQADAARSEKEALVLQLEHDLRNPLNVISTGIEVLQRPGLNPAAARSAIEVVARQTRRVAGLLSDIVNAPHLPAAAPATKAPTCEAACCGRRVLVLQDNPAAKQTLCAALMLEGHSVTSADDGAVGLQMLVNNRPEIAIVDVGLPGLDGFEVALRARAAGYAGRLIALWEPGQTQTAARALRSGFDAHVSKPVDPQHLRRLMGVV